MTNGHQHLGPPLLRNPGLPFERVRKRIGVGKAAIEDDLADLDVPEGAGVVEAALAESDEQNEPDGEEERRFRPEQSLHRRPPHGALWNLRTEIEARPENVADRVLWNIAVTR